MSRIIADEHWASDTLVGVGTGLLYGYFLPKWLHYDRKKRGASAGIIGGASSDPRSPVRAWAPHFKPVDNGGVLGVAALF
jgi:membrane-associated phospholipid phosphatase